MKRWDGFDRPPLWTSRFCHDLHCMWNGCVMDGIPTLTRGFIWRLILLSLLDPFKVQSNCHLPSFLFFPPTFLSRKVCRVLVDKNQSGPQIGSVMTASSFYLQWLWERQSMILLLLASWYTCQTISGLSQREMGRLWVRHTWNMCRKYRLSSHTKKWIQNRLNTLSTEVLLFIAWWK